MISIFNGGSLFETRECALTVLPDGRQGAIWRGLAYPLEIPDQRIEIGSEAFTPGECTPPDIAAAPHRPKFAVVEGAENAYVLVSGPVVVCEDIAGRLRVAGYDVIRTGRYLGDPVDNFVADWFIRVVWPATAELSLEALLVNAFDKQGVDPRVDTAIGNYRAQLIATELAAVKAREIGLRTELVRLKHELTDASDAQAQIEELKAAFEAERKLREQSDSTAADALQRLTEAPQESPQQPLRVGKVKDEIEVVFTTLLPEVRLLRDSLMVVSAEFSNRRALYRGLAELRTAAGRLPPTWKKLKGLDSWWERHMSDGQDDAGRVYARLSTSEGIWNVLVSHKGEQTRDLAWLARQ